MSVLCAEYPNGTWWLEAMLEDPTNATSGDGLGYAVALQGEHALVSAPFRGAGKTGAAYLFRTFNGSDWYARVRLTAADATLAVPSRSSCRRLCLPLLLVSPARGVHECVSCVCLVRVASCCGGYDRTTLAQPWRWAQTGPL